MTSYPSPQCLSCTNYSHGGFRSCAAYPQDRSIPDDYWLNVKPHTTPTDGYAFEQDPDMPEPFFVPQKETSAASG